MARIKARVKKEKSSDAYKAHKKRMKTLAKSPAVKKHQKEVGIKGKDKAIRIERASGRAVNKMKRNVAKAKTAQRKTTKKLVKRVLKGSK